MASFIERFTGEADLPSVPAATTFPPSAIPNALEYLRRSMPMPVAAPATAPTTAPTAPQVNPRPDFPGMTERMRQMTPAERLKVPAATGSERNPRTGRTSGLRTPSGFPDFTKFLEARTPQAAFDLFRGLLNNPAISGHLPPFLRGPNSPLTQILDRLGREIGGVTTPTAPPTGPATPAAPAAPTTPASPTAPATPAVPTAPQDPISSPGEAYPGQLEPQHGWGQYPNDDNVPAPATPGRQSSVAPGNQTGGGATPGPDVPATQQTATDTGDGSPAVAPSDTGTVATPGAAPLPAAGNLPAPAEPTDGGAANLPAVGPTAPRRGALAALERSRDAPGTGPAPASPAPQPTAIPGQAPPAEHAPPAAVPLPPQQRAAVDYPPAVLAVGGRSPAAFIVHHTGGRGTVDGVRHTLRQRGLGVQYVADRKGNITQIGGPGAQHIMTGWGSGRGLSNRNTVGIEVIARNNADVTRAQINAVQDFIAARYPNTPVFGHGQVNPGHKEADEGMAIVNAVRIARGRPQIAAQR